MASLSSLLIGLVISTVGIDIATGHARFTFGSIDLLDGISFIPAMIGFFAVSQVLRSALRPGQGERVAVDPMRRIWGVMWGQLRRFKVLVLWSSLVGNLLGALPGAGAAIAA